MTFAVEPAEQANEEKQAFAEMIRAARPAAEEVMLFRTESHLLAFHLGRPLYDPRRVARSERLAGANPARTSWSCRRNTCILHSRSSRSRRLVEVARAGGLHSGPAAPPAGVPANRMTGAPSPCPSPHRRASRLGRHSRFTTRADRLEKVVPAWGDALARLGRDYEIVVVDDGSTDTTPAILERLTAGRVGTSQALKHDTRKGFGACLKTALDEVKQPLLLYTSLDYPYSPADLGSFWHGSRSATRCSASNRTSSTVAGLAEPSRRPIEWLAARGGSSGGSPWACNQPLPAWPGLREYLYGLLAGWTFGVPFVDVNSRFKLFRTAFLHRVPIQSDSAFVHTELVAKATFLTSIMDEIALSPAIAIQVPRPSMWKEIWRVSTNRTSERLPLPSPANPVRHRRRKSR